MIFTKLLSLSLYLHLTITRIVCVLTLVFTKERVIKKITFSEILFLTYLRSHPGEPSVEAVRASKVICGASKVITEDETVDWEEEIVEEGTDFLSDCAGIDLLQSYSLSY